MNRKEYEKKRIAMARKRDKKFYCEHYSIDELTKVIFTTDLDTLTFWKAKVYGLIPNEGKKKP